MATVKFSDEMPKPTSIKGTDRFLISDGVTGEAKAPDFNQAKEYLNITGIEMEPLVGGTTSGTALVVPNGPAGEQRTAEVSSGKWYDFGSGPVEASADRRWKSYWNGTSWVLKDMGELPQQDITPLENDIEQLKNTTSNLENNAVAIQASEEDLTIFMDNDGKAFSKFDKDSEFFVAGIKGSVQQNIKQIPTGIMKINESDHHIFSDNDGNAVAKFDKDSSLILTGLEGSVQENINGTKEIITTHTSEEVLLPFADNLGNVFAMFDKESKLILSDMDMSVQDSINDIKKPYPQNSKLLADTHNDLHPKIVSLLNRRNAYGLSNIAVPHGIFPQEWDFDINAIKTLQAPLVSGYEKIGMYNATAWNPDSGVVHPYVTSFDFPVCGYKYWMALTGYPAESWEVTWLYGTNNDDLTGWKLIDNAPQPFDPNPKLLPPYISSHGSDCFITYNPFKGEIIVGYRLTMRWHPTLNTGQTNEIRYRSTHNGIDWSEQKVLNPPVTADIDLMQAPSIVYDPDRKLFLMFDVHPGQIKYRTNPDIEDPNGWSEAININAPEGVTPWHLEAKYVGRTLVILVHEDQVVSRVYDRLWFCATNDLENWVWSDADVFGLTSNIYKSSFLPVYNGDGTMKFKIIYTTDEHASADQQWRLKITETNNFNI